MDDKRRKAKQEIEELKKEAKKQAIKELEEEGIEINEKEKFSHGLNEC